MLQNAQVVHRPSVLIHTGTKNFDSFGVIKSAIQVDGGHGAGEPCTRQRGLATPPHYYDGLPGNPGALHHLFSLVDDGVHGTAVARIVSVAEASVNLNAASIDEFGFTNPIRSVTARTAAPALLEA